MGSTVKHLDYSGWTAEQLARKAGLEHRHPFQSALKQASAESIDRSELGEWRMSSRDYGNGLKESALWMHRPNLEKSLQRAIDRDEGEKRERGDGDLAENVARASRRAKQQVRIWCKSVFVNSLWTLTFKENVIDRDLVLKLLDRFRRRVEKLLPGWKYLAVLERQERGAWHVHLATHALPRMLAVSEHGGKPALAKSWDVMRAVWRTVLANDGLHGNFDEAKRKGNGRGVKGAGKIARYIAKYVAKDMQENQLNRKRYSCSKGIQLPDAVRASFAHDSRVAGLLELAYSAVGARITHAFYDPVSQVFFVESDDSLSSRLPP